MVIVKPAGKDQKLNNKTKKRLQTKTRKQNKRKVPALIDISDTYLLGRLVK